MKPAVTGATTLVAAVVIAAPARGASPEWHPGERTTSTVSPEVDDPARSTGDGVYGRFSGDLDLGGHAGAQATGDGVAAVWEVSAHYFSMAGATVRYADSFGNDRVRFQRSVSLGVDMRPAFVPRWSQNMQRGPGFLDLAVDSISVSLGVFWAAPTDEHTRFTRGFEGSIGFSLPLMGSAEGLWLDFRGIGRWPDPTGEGDARQFGLLAMLAWHSLLFTPL